MDGHRHIVIGFQGSGKTTFAAALWHLVDARSKEAPTALSKGRHSGDYTYLEAIAAAWESGYQVKRTGVGTWQPIAINLRSKAVEGDIELSFVDMSGETFEQIFTSRECEVRIEKMIRGCEGLLLFVSAERKIDDATLVDIGIAVPDEMPDELEDDEDDDELFNELNLGGDGDGEGEPPGASPPRSGAGEGGSKPAASAEAEGEPIAAAPAGTGDFSPALTPRQVQIVDLLDALADAPVRLRPARVAVIVSAWDLVPAGVSPEAWLARSMPLLEQYLINRAREFETRVYGVSAQGGRLPKREKPDEESDRSALLAEPVASRRIRVVGHGSGIHDLTHPIAWLSGLEQ